jgi:hypothetical protein
MPSDFFQLYSEDQFHCAHTDRRLCISGWLVLLLKAPNYFNSTFTINTQHVTLYQTIIWGKYSQCGFKMLENQLQLGAGCIYFIIIIIIMSPVVKSQMWLWISGMLILFFYILCDHHHQSLFP